jgi:type VII secretion integral membrane protein EccD
MARTFTRVTFTGPRGTVDVSVPDDLPVALLVRQVCDLLRAPADGRWVITHPIAGDLDPDATFRDTGVLDGAVLYLRAHGDGYQSPYVEDVAEEVGDDAEAVFWNPAATRLVLTATAGVWLGLTPLALLWRFGASDAVPLLAVVFSVLLAGAMAGWLARRHEVTMAFGWALAPAAGSLAGAVGVTVGATVEQVTAGVAAAVAVTVGLTALLVPEERREGMWTALLGTVVTAVALVVWGQLAASPIGGDRAAAVVGFALLLAQSPLPRAATQLSGLGRLADAAAEGEPVVREQVRSAARQARTILSGLLTGCGVPVVAMVAILALGGAWQRGLAVLLVIALLLRVRHFSRPAHVLPVAISGLAGLAAFAGGLLWSEGLGGAPATAAAVLSGLALAGAAVAQPASAVRVRLRVTLDRAETLVLIASGIALFGVFNAYAWAFSVVR